MGLGLFVLSVLISAVMTRWIRDLAVSRQWVSSTDPSGLRSGQNSAVRELRTQPVPRLGGVAIFLTLWIMVLVARWIPGNTLGTHVSLGILGPATIVFLLGLLDDIRGVSPYHKFAVQIIAALLLYVSGFGISAVTWTHGTTAVSWMIGLPLTVLWVLWITNAFNLLDGLDGLAAGSALFSILVIAVIAFVSNNQPVLFLTLILAGAVAGFLRYNFNPASIFLGDCGSLVIGFTLSAIALAGSQKSQTMVAVAIPIVSLGLPILDVAVSVVRRFLSRQRLFEADHEHIHHRLIKRGVSHRQAVLLLYGVSACFALLSLFLLNPGTRTVGIVLAVIGLGVLIGLQQLRYHELFELKQTAGRTLKLRQAIANNVGIRRASEQLRSCSTASELCLTLQNCLMPVGFDGFGFFLHGDTAHEIECFPLTRAGKHEFNFFWDSSLVPSQATWRLTFALQNNGHRVGTFTLYRRETGAPLWLDFNLLTQSDFCAGLTEVIDGIRQEWLAVGERPVVPSEKSSKSPVVSLPANDGGASSANSSLQSD